MSYKNKEREEERIAKKKANARIYYQKNKEKICERVKIYSQKPEVIAKEKIRKSSPKYKAQAKKHYNEPVIKERRERIGKINRKKPKIIASTKIRNKKFRQSKHGKEVIKKWEELNSEYNKKYQKEYSQSEKGKEVIKKWKENNPEKLKVSWDKSNKTKEAIASREKYRQSEKGKAVIKKWVVENYDKIKKKKKRWEENNPEKIKGYHKKWRENNPIQYRIHSLLKLTMKLYSTTGKIQSSNKYGIDIPGIIKQLTPFPKDIENYHIDHIIPLSWFNHDDPKEIQWAWAPENHQWLTKEENMKKGNKYILIGEMPCQ